MRLTMRLASKLHGLTVTQANLHYAGSIFIPREIAAEASLREGDAVEVYNFASGARYRTYVMYGDQGEVHVNGPSARLSVPGDRLVLAQYVWTDGDEEPVVLWIDEHNRVTGPAGVFPSAHKAARIEVAR